MRVGLDIGTRRTKVACSAQERHGGERGIPTAVAYTDGDCFTVGQGALDTARADPGARLFRGFHEQLCPDPEPHGPAVTDPWRNADQPTKVLREFLQSALPAESRDGMELVIAVPDRWRQHPKAGASLQRAASSVARVGSCRLVSAPLATATYILRSNPSNCDERVTRLLVIDVGADSVDASLFSVESGVLSLVVHETSATYARGRVGIEFHNALATLAHEKICKDPQPPPSRIQILSTLEEQEQEIQYRDGEECIVPARESEPLKFSDIELRECFADVTEEIQITLDRLKTKVRAELGSPHWLHEHSRIALVGGFAHFPLVTSAVNGQLQAYADLFLPLEPPQQVEAAASGALMVGGEIHPNHRYSYEVSIARKVREDGIRRNNPLELAGRDKLEIGGFAPTTAADPSTKQPVTVRVTNGSVPPLIVYVRGRDGALTRLAAPWRGVPDGDYTLGLHLDPTFHGSLVLSRDNDLDEEPILGLLGRFPTAAQPGEDDP